jgi:hypothetical protein
VTAAINDPNSDGGGGMNIVYEISNMHKVLMCDQNKIYVIV